MTPTQAARLIGISPSQVRVLIRSGKIKAKRIPSRNNQHGHVYAVTETEAIRFRDAPVSERRGYPRGRKRK